MLSQPRLVKFDELSEAFEFVSSGQQCENNAYIHTDTGTIYYVSQMAGIDELPDDFETSENYVEIPHRNELNLGRDLVFTFVDKNLPDEFNAVADIFRRRGAYSRFKDLLQAGGMLDSWYEFEKNAIDAALRNWCQETGIRLSDP